MRSYHSYWPAAAVACCAPLLPLSAHRPTAAPTQRQVDSVATALRKLRTGFDTVLAVPPGVAPACRGQEIPLAHQPQHPGLSHADPLGPQADPDLPMPLAAKRRGRQDHPKLAEQRRLTQRRPRTVLARSDHSGRAGPAYLRSATGFTLRSASTPSASPRRLRQALSRFRVN